MTGSRNEDVRDLSACNAMLQCHIQPSHMPVGPEDWQNITKVLRCADDDLRVDQLQLLLLFFKD